MARYQAVRGTFDVLPEQMPVWHKIEGTARDLAPRFGYQEIRTPLFEDAELFTRGMGVMSGLIEKELWTFNDKFGQKLALRTDATTGVIRCYQQNKLYNANTPLKVFYLAPVFLLGKEGEIRSRQSHQFGFEAIGTDNPALDAEVIALAAAYCEELGLDDYTIRLNSLGGKDCRPLYLQKLRDYFGSNVAQLCSTCKRKYKANPDWVLSCEEAGCKSLSQVAPTIYGMLTNEAKTNFSMLREYLEEMDLPLELDPRVVRDSEYYNGPVFEIRSKGKSLGFGGRYDGLIEKLGGKPTPAVGFAFSLETVMEVLKEGEEKSSPPSFDVLLRPEGPESAKLLVPLLYTLRQRGVTAELDYSYTNGRRQREGGGEWSYLVTLDESNAFRGTAILRDIEDNSDEKVPVQRLRNRVLHVAGVGSEEERDGSQSGRKKLRRGRRRPEEDKRDADGRESKDEETESSSRSGRKLRSKSRRGRGSEDRDSRRPARTESRDEDSGREAQESRESSREARGSRDSRDAGEPREAREPREPREPRESRHPREAKDSRESKDVRNPRESQDSRDTRNARNKRPVRDKNREISRENPRESSEPERDQGKALVPAFNLGGSLGDSAAQASAQKKARPQKAVTTANPANSLGAGGGGLNWSIIPGKEGP